MDGTRELILRDGNLCEKMPEFGPPILKALILAKGAGLTASELHERFWRRDGRHVEKNTVAQTISRMNGKLGVNLVVSKNGRYVLTGTVQELAPDPHSEYTGKPPLPPSPEAIEPPGFSLRKVAASVAVLLSALLVIWWVIPAREVKLTLKRQATGAELSPGMDIRTGESFDMTLPAAGTNRYFISIGGDGTVKVFLSREIRYTAWKVEESPPIHTVILITAERELSATQILELNQQLSACGTPQLAEGMMLRWQKDGYDVLPKSARGPAFANVTWANCVAGLLRPRGPFSGYTFHVSER